MKTYFPLIAKPWAFFWPIAAEVFTTAEQQIHPVGLSAETPQIAPADVPLYAQYGYSAWYSGDGLPPVKRTELAPGSTNAVPAARLLTFFTISDIHIADKESPATVNYVAWSASFGNANSSAWSPVVNSTTQVLDAAVQTINALHKKTPFDFGISLGDTINNTQYNELRWYIDVLDGQLITPSSGAHVGAATIDYQKPFQAVGLDKAIPWYQVIGNHDQFWMGSVYENPKLLQAHVGNTVLNMGLDPNPIVAVNETGVYMGVVDGATPYGDIIKAGPEANFPNPPTVVADANRRSLATAVSSSQNWMREFLTTTSNPVGHGFTQTSVDNDFTSYSFQPKPDIPIKIIALDDTCKGAGQPNYAAGCLDQARIDWLQGELQQGQDENKLMIIAAHVPVNPQTHLIDDGTRAQVFNTPADTALIAILQNYPNLILWIAGHRHLNTVTAQPYDSTIAGQGPPNSFWEVETASLRDFPQEFRTFDIRRNSDNTISIIITNVDPAVVAGSPAEKSRGYAIGAARVDGTYTLSDTASQAYNAELVKQLTPAMQAIIANYGSPL
ncbi:MAG: TIGR03768 family metallophosphoesterase [Deltaproteobacteria bacterium]|nr:TIGR03768 family metallophosphoesterase [Deltaproteobacteria bacterium]